jgi:hypothetical protein
VDALAYIALDDASVDWQHGSAQCLLGGDILGYDFLYTRLLKLSSVM